ncbi:MULTISPECIES: acylphosphatase [unclassified Spirillospora]|uniref:acylphosphatase n=1 Tax=unclassified Spirillospora TaxID=2642701 RepID=UPI00370FA5D3
MDGGDEDIVRLTAWVRGHVQGVGFRWWVRARALELGLDGTAANLADGRVEVVAEGPRRKCRRLLELLDGDAPAGLPGRPGKVTGVTCRWSEPRGEGSGFHER